MHISQFGFQLETLNTNVKMAANFLQRCPSCMTNFVQHICDFTCSPQQSQFMKVEEVEKGDKGECRLSAFVEFFTSR